MVFSASINSICKECHREPEGRGDLLRILSAGDCFVTRHKAWRIPRNDMRGFCKQTLIFTKLFFIFFLFIISIPSALASPSKLKRHVLSWESAKAPIVYRRLKGETRSIRQLHVSYRRVIRFEKSSFWNRRPFQFTTPLYHHDLLYVGVDAGKFYALETKPMRKKWVFETEGAVHASADLDQDVVFFGDVRGNVYALNAMSGILVWQRRLDDEILSPPLASEGKLYVVTQSGRLFALDRETGDEVWHTEAYEKSWGFSVRKATKPVAAFGKIFVGTATGMLMAYHPEDGSLAWVRQLGDRRELVYDVDATIVPFANTLLCSSADGKLSKVDALDGRIIWSRDVGGVNDLLLANEKLYVTGSGVLTSLHPVTGDFHWQQDFETAEISSAAGGENFLAVVSTSDKFWFLDQDTGDILQRLYVRKGSLGDPLVIANEVYVVSNKGRLLGYRMKELKPRHVQIQ
ncbi:MAG: hypothetical protein A3C46_07690 [Deltaproteobacteria bacterium RIFCSPHIGHO2_02_FULL_44_16]|nr:MAG: hypothetical protein A3C46_07690 [Deltaproteobacteria bacterium RIFCSPHIGHO2_02_FULL_44_16]